MSAKRHATIKAYWEAAESIAAQTVAQAFSAVSRQRDCGAVACEDALPLFVAAFRRDLRSSGY
jgi:hypothetical protein